MSENQKFCHVSIFSIRLMGIENLYRVLYSVPFYRNIGRNRHQPPWRNRLARCTYRLKRCGGCEFEPHRGHIFLPPACSKDKANITKNNEFRWLFKQIG